MTAPATGWDRRLGLLVGDGIGAEIVPAAVDVVDAALHAEGAAAVQWRELPMGLSAIASHGSPMPESTLEELGALQAWLLGPHDSASYPDAHRSALNPSGTIRKRFDLYANIRPARSFPAAGVMRAPAIDLVIARENTEGFYADRNTFAGTGEFMPTPDVAIALCIITRPAVERIAREAFALAERRRGKVSIAHKANVLRLTTGMFRDICFEIAADHPGVTVDDFHIDALAARLVRRADQFDVIVAENMFGDILSDLAGEVAGSLGIAPSINHSDTQVMAQASHGSAPDIAGRDQANPTAMILSAAMLLDWLAARHQDAPLAAAARRVEAAVDAVIGAGTATVDLGGDASCSVFASAVRAQVKG